MMKTKTPRPRSSKSRRASAVTAAAKAEGSSPSRELSLQLEHVSLFPLLSDRPHSALKPIKELLEESRDRAPPPPPPALQQPPPPPALQPQASPMDADEPVEEKDCCILSQDFFYMDALLLKEAEKHGMHVEEVDGTRTTISNLEGVIFDITLK